MEKKKSRAAGRSATRSRTKKSGKKKSNGVDDVDVTGEKKGEFLSDLKQAVEKT